MLTEIGRHTIREADVVVGIPRLLSNIAFDTQQQITVNVNIEAVLTAIGEHHPARKVTGDFGLAILANRYYVVSGSIAAKFCPALVRFRWPSLASVWIGLTPAS